MGIFNVLQVAVAALVLVLLFVAIPHWIRWIFYN